jgi:hypothetical protein
MGTIGYVMMHRASCLSFGIKEDNLFLITQLCTEQNLTIISTHVAIVFELNIAINQAAQHEEINLRVKQSEALLKAKTDAKKIH